MNMPQQPSVFYLGSYLKTPTDSILLTLCVEKDDYDNVKTITAAPEDPAKSLDVWQYCLTSAEALRLGTFLGTKYKSPSSSGVFQTIDDTLNHRPARHRRNARLHDLRRRSAGRIRRLPTRQRGLLRPAHEQLP